MRALARITAIISAGIAIGLLAPSVFCFASEVVVEEWPIEALAEPSGIVYHQQRGTLFVCGDEGDVAEVSVSGRLIKIRNIGGDLEAITTDPATGLIYVVREGHDIIFELKPGDFEITRRFTIDRSYQGNANFLQRGGDGIEGLTFVADADHAEGGRFFAVNQFDPPVLIELQVPLRTAKGKFETATIVKAYDVASAPLSGVYWSARMGTFWVISALWKAVYVLDQRGKHLRTVRIPGLMQEGIAPLPDGSFAIAQDTGSLLRWKPSADPFVVTQTEVNTGASSKKNNN